jgi:hypothetical protein
MDYTELKIWLINIATLTFTFTNIDNFLKLTALLATISYTLYKTYLLYKTNKKK